MNILNELLQWGVIAAILFVLLFQINFDLFETLPKRTTQTEESLSQQKVELHLLQNKMKEVLSQVTSMNQKISKIENHLSKASNLNELQQTKTDVASLKSELGLLNNIVKKQAIQSKPAQITPEAKVDSISISNNLIEWLSLNKFILVVVSAIVLFCVLAYLILRRRRIRSSDVIHLNVVNNNSGHEQKSA
jgi:hypothetical protein